MLKKDPNHQSNLQGFKIIFTVICPWCCFKKYFGFKHYLTLQNGLAKKQFWINGVCLLFDTIFSFGLLQMFNVLEYNHSLVCAHKIFYHTYDIILVVCIMYLWYSMYCKYNTMLICIFGRIVTALGCPKPAGQRPKTLLATRKQNNVLQSTFPSNVAMMLLRPMAPPSCLRTGQWDLFYLFIYRSVQYCIRYTEWCDTISCSGGLDTKSNVYIYKLLA